MGADFKNIPDEMKPYRQWVVWKYQERGGKKTTKVPYSCYSSHIASVTDFSTWCYFEDVVEAYLGADTYDGIGFVAKKLIMVEGIAETLLLPLLAERLGIDLKEKAVSIINVQGLNFDVFLELLAENGIKIPCAVITDSDPPKVNGEEAYPKADENSTPSSTAATLKAKETSLIKVCLSKKTFEYDLALYPANLPALVSAYKACHPQVGAELETALVSMTDTHEKTKRFFESFNPKSKGEFAQELAAKLEEEDTVFEVPSYIVDAIEHVTGEGSAAPAEAPATSATSECAS